MTTKEEAKAAAPGIGFGGVIPVLRTAGKAARAAWKSDKRYIHMKNGRIENSDGGEWLPDSDDLLAEDWQVVA